MRIEAIRGFVEFQFFEASLDYHPSLSLSIEVGSGDLAGYRQGVWFTLADTEELVRQLETLERSRQGEAKLIQMSDESEYCPFRFKIFSIDRVGNMAIFAEITQTTYIGNQSRLVANKLSLTFEIDAGILLGILKDFKVLFAQAAK